MPNRPKKQPIKASIEIKKIDRQLSRKDNESLREILGHMLTVCGMTGEYSVNAAGAAKQGGTNSRGITIGPARQNAVEFYFQAQKSKKKAVHYLLLAPNQGNEVQTKLLEKFPGSFYTPPKPQKAQKKSPGLPPLNPFYIKGFNVGNPEHAIAYATEATSRAKKFLDAVFPKTDVMHLLREFSGQQIVDTYKKELVTLGYLVPFGEEGFFVKTGNLTPRKSSVQKDTASLDVSSELDSAAVSAQQAKSDSVPKKRQKWVPNISHTMQTVLDDESKMKEFLSQVASGVSSSSEGVMKKRPLRQLTEEYLFPGRSRAFIDRFIWNLVHTKYLLQMVLVGSYTLTEAGFAFSIKDVESADDMPPKPHTVLSKPMKEAIENSQRMVAFYTAFFQQQKLKDAGCITTQELYKLMEIHLLPGKSEPTYHAFGKHLIKAGLYKRYSTSTYKLLPEGIRFAAGNSSSTTLVSDLDSSGDSMADIRASNDKLGKAVVKALRLKGLLEESDKRVQSLEDQLASETQRANDAEAKLDQQPGIALQIEQGVKKRLEEMLND